MIARVQRSRLRGIGVQMLFTPQFDRPRPPGNMESFEFDGHLALFCLYID
jgi:hypothetical protein